MRIVRNWVDRRYCKKRDSVFRETFDDPKRAHKMFERFAQQVHRFRLERLLLNCPENSLNPGFEISNAAGFNKDGVIPPTFLRHLGFDRVVIGTVTGDPWKGNDGRTIWRYVNTESMVNCEGLPGIGAERVAEVLHSYGDHKVPLTLNFMATPKKEGDELFEDLERTIISTRDLPYIDIYQLNVSCPNTHDPAGEMDAREKNQVLMDDMLGVVEIAIRPQQRVEIKVSPDLDRQGVSDSIDVMIGHPRVVGVVAANTTTEHDPRYIPNSPGKGGASGDAVYEKSRLVQRMFVEKLRAEGLDRYIRACGGISSPGKARERVSDGDGRVKGIDIYTSLIYKGPKLLRQLRAA